MKRPYVNLNTIQSVIALGLSLQLGMVMAAAPVIGRL